MRPESATERDGANAIAHNLQRLEDQRELIFHELDGISRERLWQRPEPDVWSIGDNLDHLHVFYGSMLPLMKLGWYLLQPWAHLRRDKPYKASIDNIYHRPRFPMNTGWLWPPKYGPDQPVSLTVLHDKLRAAHEEVIHFCEGKDPALLGHVVLFDPAIGRANLIQALQIGADHDALHYDVVRRLHNSDLGHGRQAGSSETRTGTGKPGPLLRFFFRLPVWLYDHGLGGIMGRRFLLLHHVGRKSGREYRTVVEVAHFTPETGTYLAASAYGRTADWYRNVRANPDVFIEVGRQTLPARAELLDAEASGDAMARYAREHPLAAPLLTRFLGLRVPGNLEGYRKLGAEKLAFVAFHTKATTHSAVTGKKKTTFTEEPEDATAHTARLNRAYTRQARLYDFAVKRLPLWRRWIGSALSHVAGPRVLEVSFGTGYLLTQLAPRYETWGIDLNARMVEVAAQNVRTLDNVFLARADVYALPFAAASFDTLVNTMALSGYPRAEPALDEMVRVLKPGGRLVMVDVGYPSDNNLLGRLLARFWASSGDILRDVPTLLTDAGLDVSVEQVGGWGSVHLYVVQKRRG